MSAALVEYMVRSVVDNPDDIQVNAIEGQASLLLELRVNPDDLDALTAPDTQLRLFGKPEVRGHRRLGVALARGETLEEARASERG